MADIVRGPVTKVIDGDTFDMEVKKIGASNKNTYKDDERIRIADIDAPELSSKAGKRSKETLEKKLQNREVRCRVQARDTYGRLVAEVQVL